LQNNDARFAYYVDFTLPRQLGSVDPSAADSRCCRQAESSGAAASRKTDARTCFWPPPSQPKLWGAAAAEIFTARRGLQ